MSGIGGIGSCAVLFNACASCCSACTCFSPKVFVFVVDDIASASRDSVERIAASCAVIVGLL